MNPIRSASVVIRNAAFVTLAVITGFCIGSALGLPVWIHGFFLIPAMLLFYRLAGEERPAFWKIIGFTALLAVYVLLISLSFKYVPKEYFWLYIIVIVFTPLGPILNWFERRFAPKKAKIESEQAASRNR